MEEYVYIVNFFRYEDIFRQLSQYLESSDFLKVNLDEIAGFESALDPSYIIVSNKLDKSEDDERRNWWTVCLTMFDQHSLWKKLMSLLKKPIADRQVDELKEILIAICQDFKELQYCKRYFLVDTLSEKYSILKCQELKCKVYAN